ncbi:MAG: ABC transporter ATP-binding protein [Candidatus Atribacteria bacterium]|nr:ABC transporter ATP-binding protein [Candidatus Atribacteria bacterium]
MIQTENLGKEYDGLKVVDGLNLKVEKGDIYGFLGPNGAGKTTTIMMLLGIIPQTEGKIYLLGEELKPRNIELKRRIGVVAENQYLYREMTAQEYLDFFGEIYEIQNPKKRIEELLEAVGLKDERNKKLGAYSKGMQQKFAFVRALLHDPELLILDEPVANLDPNGIKQIRDLIEEENRIGRTVLVSSHLLSEVEKLCKKVGIINQGKLLVEDNMDNIKRRLTDTIIMRIELNQEANSLESALRQIPYVTTFNITGNKLDIRLKTDRDYRKDLSQTFVDHGFLILSMQTKEMSLEEAFMTITHQNISLLTRREN